MAAQVADRRDETLTVRLTVAEKERLAKFALEQDRKPSTVARRFITQMLATEDAPSDGRDGA